jgi:hypothetical protein
VIFAGIALILGLLTRQPRRYWTFAGAALAIHLSAGLVLADGRPSLPGGLHAVGAALLVWGIPVMVALRGHATRNVDVAIWTLRSRVARALLGSHVTALVARTENGRLAVDPDDYTVGWQLRKRGRYGLAELERVGQYIGENSRVLDVGAHIRSLAVPLSRMCREVVAVEADSATYQFLTLNLLLNHVTNCRAFNVAASDRAGTNRAPGPEEVLQREQARPDREGGPLPLSWGQEGDRRGSRPGRLLGRPTV